MTLPGETSRRRFSYLDAGIIAALIVVGFFVYQRITTRLDYTWRWSIIPQFLFRRDESGRIVTNYIMQVLLTTLRLSIWSSVFALIIGVVSGILRLRRSVFFRFFGRLYVELVRNTPPLVLVFIFYFFIGNQIIDAIGVDSWVDRAGPATLGVIRIFAGEPARLPEFLSAVLTLAIYEGAYITEIVRAGIQSVAKGQWEAGHSLGFSTTQQYRFVILPQAARNMLPALAGQFISAIKDSAIVAVISIQELTFQGLELMSATYRTFEIWITITALYLVLTGTCSIIARRVEVRLIAHQ